MAIDQSNDHRQASWVGRAAQSTLIIVFGYGLGSVAGLIRQRVLSTTFGTSFEFDAFIAASVIPDLLVIALAGPALGFAFIPIYAGLLETSEHERANALMSHVINTVFIVLAALSGLVGILAPWLVSSSWGVGASLPQDTQLLTVNLMRLFTISTTIFAISGILTGTLHAHQHFLLPSLAPAFYALGIIVGALLFSRWLGIYGLTWGAVLGAVLHLGIQIPALVRFGVRWTPSLNLGNPTLRRVIILMVPRFVDLVMARISISWINANIASGMGEGRISALQYAYQLQNMPQTLIGTAIGLAIFPTMAALAAKNDVDSQREALSGSLRAVLTLTVPAAVGLLILGRPLIQVLLEDGEFTPVSTQLVFFALQYYTLALVSSSLLEVVVRAFAAQQDTLTPLVVSFFTTALNIGLAIWLSSTWLEHGGLPLANGIAVGIESLIGLIILHFRWKGINARSILFDLAKAAVSAMIMGASIMALQSAFDLPPIVALIGGASLGIVVYFSAALLLGMEDIKRVPLALIRSVRERIAPEAS